MRENKLQLQLKARLQKTVLCEGFSLSSRRRQKSVSLLWLLSISLPRYQREESDIKYFFFIFFFIFFIIEVKKKTKHSFLCRGRTRDVTLVGTGLCFVSKLTKQITKRKP